MIQRWRGSDWSVHRAEYRARENALCRRRLVYHTDRPPVVSVACLMQCWRGSDWSVHRAEYRARENAL